MTEFEEKEVKGKAGVALLVRARASHEAADVPDTAKVFLQHVSVGKPVDGVQKYRTYVVLRWDDSEVRLSSWQSEQLLTSEATPE